MLFDARADGVFGSPTVESGSNLVLLGARAAGAGVVEPPAGEYERRGDFGCLERGELVDAVGSLDSSWRGLSSFRAISSPFQVSFPLPSTCKRSGTSVHVGALD